jgi:CheY-like chemotaxis protein
VQNEKLTRLRVLVADDNDDVRSTAVKFLQSSFEIVGAVATGWELVEMARRLDADVIVSDLCMPGLTGAGAFQMLRALGHSAAFVLMSASVRSWKTWIDMGMRAVVDKRDLHVDLVPAVHAAVTGEIYISRSALK